jgi:D-alanyl-D-alanine dipeptidase
MSITSGYRSIEEQKSQIAQKCKNPPGSAKCDPKGKVTACILKDLDPKNCPHTTGKALDIWGTKLGSTSQCIMQDSCNAKLGDQDPCALDECQAALIAAMRDASFCRLDSEAWHFEKPIMSTDRCH